MFKYHIYLICLSDAFRRRSTFQQQHKEESILRDTTDFVERYLHERSVWKLDDKEQNVLTYEVHILYYNELYVIEFPIFRLYV